MSCRALSLSCWVLYIIRISCWKPGKYFVFDNPKGLWHRRGTELTVWTYRRCTGIIARVGLSYGFPHLQQIKGCLSVLRLCSDTCKQEESVQPSLWHLSRDKKKNPKKKKQSVPPERSLIIAQTERKPERPGLHGCSLPVAHSCARLHSRNAALRSVIVSVQWAWHGHSVKNNSAQKQRFRLQQQVRQNLHKDLPVLR